MCHVYYTSTIAPFQAQTTRAHKHYFLSVQHKVSMVNSGDFYERVQLINCGQRPTESMCSMRVWCEPLASRVAPLPSLDRYSRHWHQLSSPGLHSPPHRGTPSPHHSMAVTLSCPPRIITLAPQPSSQHTNTHTTTPAPVRTDSMNRQIL